MPGPAEPEGYGVPNVPSRYVMIPDRPNNPANESIIIAGIDRELEGLGTFFKNLGFRMHISHLTYERVAIWWVSEDKKCPSLWIQSEPKFIHDQMHLALDEHTIVSLTKEGEKEGWHDQPVAELKITQIAEIKAIINQFYEAQGSAMLGEDTPEPNPLS